MFLISPKEISPPASQRPLGCTLPAITNGAGSDSLRRKKESPPALLVTIWSALRV